MTKPKTESFVCDQCGGVFPKVISDDEAMAEAIEEFGEEAMNNAAVVCSDCYEELTR